MWWCYFLIELVNILGITLEVFDKQGHEKGIHVFMVLDIPTECPLFSILFSCSKDMHDNCLFFSLCP